MCCDPSTEAEEDAVSFPIRRPLDDNQAIRLLGLQAELKRLRWRGSAGEVAKWVECRDLRSEVGVNSESVGFLVCEGDLEVIGSSFKLGTYEYQSSAGLDERDFLYSEIASGSILGTCVAIGGCKILTARHVLDGKAGDCLRAKKLWAIFGFGVQADGQTRTVFDSRIHMAKVAPQALVNLNEDFQGEWLVLDIDRPFSELGGLRPAAVSDNRLADSAAVYTFGYPNGLSLRFGFSPSTVPCPEAPCFLAFIDGYRGASGSPIFDTLSHKIVGIALASGQNDGAVRIKGQLSLSQVCTPLTSRGVSCLHRP